VDRTGEALVLEQQPVDRHLRAHRLGDLDQGVGDALRRRKASRMLGVLTEVAMLQAVVADVVELR
jgi:hypothetical protein